MSSIEESECDFVNSIVHLLRLNRYESTTTRATCIGDQANVLFDILATVYLELGRLAHSELSIEPATYSLLYIKPSHYSQSTAKYRPAINTELT